MDDVARLVEGLTKAQRAALGASPSDDWFAATIVTEQAIASAGSLLAVMARKGLFERRGDPTTWGRSQYCILPLGLAVRAALQSTSGEGEGRG